MGFRLAIAMGYHHHDAKLRAGPMQSSSEIAHRETCRRAFWGAFLLDRYTAIGGGKALGINDDDISVLLPLRDEDWQTPDVAPPLSALEFFKPVNLHAAKSATSTESPSTANRSAKNQEGHACQSSSNSSITGSSCNVSGNVSPMDQSTTPSRHSTPPLSSSGWDSRAGEASRMGYFVKLMSVVGQIAQYINTSKAGTSSSDDTSAKSGRLSPGYAALDTALMRWMGELPITLSYSEAKSMDTEPETAVFISCMHAIYYGAVIMLNRENIGLLRDLPGQLDVSTNLAIRSLERCRVAAMEIVEITHHICTLPSAMTNALLPWALFQAGTLLIHFMIAGSMPQAQEEARSAILSIDSALKNELSRYWSVSTKYHLVLSNMVKAWERTRQSTPSQQTNMKMQTQSQNQSAAGNFGNSAVDTFQMISAQTNMPMQMQMHMQLPNSSHIAGSQQDRQSQANHADAFSTLLKPFSAPSPRSLGIIDGENAISHMAHGQSVQPSFSFTADTAQDSINTLNAFFSQLSQEQARQFNEGLQS
ncbi:hypothetical protein GGF37_005739, partial [Kickxella alabastrina]